MHHLQQVCFNLLGLQRWMSVPASRQQDAFCRWLLRVDALLSRFARFIPELPDLDPEPEDYGRWIHSAMMLGALQLVPVAARERSRLWDEPWASEFPGMKANDDPILTFLCESQQWHVVCLQPYFRLFEFGLDPALTREGGSLLSALQLARNFIRDHPAPSTDALVDSMESAIAADLTQDPEAQTASLSMLRALAMQQRCDDEDEEEARREDLHARFMFALVPAWCAHSAKVFALILEASPSSLIPDLARIVGGYLDLEGLPPEPIAPVTMDEEAKEQQ